jgi:5-methylthioadenosine/S-adenosylhomocysteine deaminase
MNSADLLIIGGTLVTMDAKSRVIEDGAVAIRKGAIATVGARADIESRYKAQKTIDASGALVLPGLINGHAHTAMSLARFP